MFAEHALALSSKYRCVLLDLPGHGSRMDEPLTMSSAIATLKEVVDEESDVIKGQKPVLIGGSLGGYISMEFLGLYPTLVSGAVICMAGQCVGVGRGCAAALGIRLMNVVITNFSEAQILKGVISEARKNGHMSTESILKMSLRTGMFFHQALSQTDILSSTNSAAALSRFHGPILFINGSRDHRDSEQLWLDSVQTEGQVESKLIVYEGADHFFSHDTRFQQRLIDDMKGFLSDVFARTS
jgi:pimeloyl-ACP methyl ester carboxylesterase